MSKALTAIQKWIAVDDALVKEEIVLGERYNIVNLDALHTAAAIRGKTDRFVTT